MTDLNVFSCTGRLGADPESRTFTSGDPVVNMRVAVSERWKDQSGEKRERTLWMPVKITNKGLCSVAERFCNKGSRVALSGKLESRSYEKDGKEVWVTELVIGPFGGSLTLLDGPGDRQDAKPSQPASTASYGADKQRVAPQFDAGGGDDDGEIPF